MTWKVELAESPAPIHLVVEVQGKPIVHHPRWAGEQVRALRAHVWLTIAGQPTTVSVEGEPVERSGERGPDPARITFSDSQLQAAGPVVGAIVLAARGEWARGAATAKAILAESAPELVLAIFNAIGGEEWTQAELRAALGRENVKVADSTLGRALRLMGESGVLASRLAPSKSGGKPLVWRRAL